jgi:hypothetical protein
MKIAPPGRMVRAVLLCGRHPGDGFVGNKEKRQAQLNLAFRVLFSGNRPVTQLTVMKIAACA